MSSKKRSVLPLVAALSLLDACGAAQTASAQRFAVHIDHVDPALAASFVDARAQWVGVLRQNHATDLRGLIIDAGDRFYTLHPFRDYAYLDTLGARRRAAIASIAPERRSAYDRTADAALVAPHHNEIWVIEPDLSRVASAQSLVAARGVLVFEVLRPGPCESEYERRHAELIAGLPAGMSRITFSSVYGSGAVISLWLGQNLEPSGMGALECSLTRDACTAHTEFAGRCIVSREILAARIRAELNSPGLDEAALRPQHH